MKFHESFLEEIRTRLPVSQVISRRVPLKRRGREFVGLSPFNKEKTPSFTVNDQKGFYHDFSSGKHGDIFTFLMETEGLSFPEAVEQLAGEAGVPMPKPDPRYERMENERLGLLDALEAAAKLFEEALRSSMGRQALEYAEGRGLSQDTIEEFRIGYAPDGRDRLKTALLKRGFTEAQLLDAGLIIKPDDGRPTYDRFRNRLIIPILDAKSRVIAFGARALDPDAQPKYLNSPETKLFDKGSMVFNFARARTPAFEKNELIVVEGYMDVIALHQAGFKNVVATLGTAFTERQIEQLWLLAPEPVVCFDGDRAGKTAAERAIDRMLPNLREGQSFRFAFLPKGLDPDDLVRVKGEKAFGALLEAALPLADALWERETRDADLSTPEQKAKLETEIQKQVDTIRNPSVRKHYFYGTRIRLIRLFSEHDRTKRPRRSSGLIPDVEGAPLERLILGLLVEFPELFEKHLERIARLQFSDLHNLFKRELQRIIELPHHVTIATFYQEVADPFVDMLDYVHGAGDPEQGLARGYRLFQRFPILRKHPPPEFVEGCLLLFTDKVELHGIRMEVDEAMRDFQTSGDAKTEERLLLLIEEEELQQKRIHDREVELDTWAIVIKTAFATGDALSSEFDGADRFERTLARAKAEVALHPKKHRAGGQR
jgi:DNA primase